MVQYYFQQFRHWELFGSSGELVRWQNCNMFTNQQQCSWFLMREREWKKGREREQVTVSHLIRASSHPHVCGGDIPVYTDGYLWLAMEAWLWKLLAGLAGEVPWTTDEAASLGPFQRQEFRKGEDMMKRSGNAPFAFLRTLIWFLMWKFNKLTERMRDRPTTGDLYIFS